MAVDCLYEERAAIMHYLGGLSVADAEDAAYRICYRRVEQYTKRDGSVEFKHTLVAPGGKQPAEKQVAKPEEQQTSMSFEDFQSQYRQRYGHE